MMKTTAIIENNSLDSAFFEKLMLCAAVNLVYKAPPRGEVDTNYQKFQSWIKDKLGESAADRFTQITTINKLNTKNIKQQIESIAKKKLIHPKYLTNEFSQEKNATFKRLQNDNSQTAQILQIIMRFFIHKSINANFSLNDEIQVNNLPPIRLIHLAALINSPALIEELITMGANYDLPIENSPLMISISRNFPELCAWLLEKKYVQLTEDDANPLYYHIFEHGLESCCNALIAHKILPQKELYSTPEQHRSNNPKLILNITGVLCQQLNTSSDKAKVLKRMFANLLQQGLRVDGIDPEGKTSHLLAILLNRVDVLEILLQHSPVDREFLNKVYHVPELLDGTLLTAATQLRQIKSVKLLLDSGADPNLPLNPTKHRPMAKLWPFDHVLRNLLLQHHAQIVETGIRFDLISDLSDTHSPRFFDANKSVVRSQRPLIDTILSGSLENLRDSLLRAESPNLTEQDTQSPLCYAFILYCNSQNTRDRKKYQAMIELLLKSGANPNAALLRNRSFSALDLICQEGLTEFIACAIDAGGDIHQTSSNALNPLLLCCLEGNLTTLRMIAKSTESKLYRNKDDFISAFTCAIQNHHYHLIPELLRYIDPSSLNSYQEKAEQLTAAMLLKFLTLKATEQRVETPRLIETLAALNWYFELELNNPSEIVELAELQEPFILCLAQMREQVSSIKQEQQRMREQITMALNQYSIAHSVKIQWQVERCFFTGFCNNVVQNLAFFQGILRDSGMSLTLAQQNVIIQIFEPNKNYIENVCTRLTPRTPLVSQIETNESASQSGLSFLTQRLGSIQSAKEFQSSCIAAFENTPVPIARTIPSAPAIITWADGLIRSTDVGITPMTNMKHFVFYSEPLMKAQGCPDHIFECLSKVLAAGSNRVACLKRIQGVTPSVNINIGGKFFENLPITLEAKNSSIQNRILLAPFLSDCIHYILYISVYYLPQGLHVKNVLTQLHDSAQNVITLPWSKISDESERISPRK